MAVSRPLLLTLVGAMLMVATFLAAQGARTAAGPASQVVQPPPTPSPPKADTTAGKPGGAPADKQGKTKAVKAKADKAKPGERTAKEKAAAAAKPAEEALAERKPARVVGLPAPVAQALANKKVVVLFFFQDAADDDATGKAVNSLRDIRGVRIFRDGIANLAKYRAVTAGLGVAQAPAVVVVGRDRNAQLLEGFVDEATLTQITVDAR